MQATIAAKPKGVDISSKRPKEVLKWGNKTSSPIFSVLYVSANLKRIDLINIDIFKERAVIQVGGGLPELASK
jgi:hypothetical protein